MLTKIKTPEVASSAWFSRFLDCCVCTEAPWLGIESKWEGFWQKLGIGLSVCYTLISFIFPIFGPRSDHNVFPCLSFLIPRHMLLSLEWYDYWLWRLKTLIIYNLLLIKLKVFDVWVVVLMAISLYRIQYVPSTPVSWYNKQVVEAIHNNHICYLLPLQFPNLERLLPLHISPG